MINGQPAYVSAIHHHGHSSSHPYQQFFAVEDVGSASASGGSVRHRFHHQQQQASSANGNLGLGTAVHSLFAGQPGACGTPTGPPVHPLPLPFRPAAAAGLPANYNTAGQAVAHQHQFVRSAILTPQRMASYSAQQQDDELVRLQELSNKWEPDATGPLVSELLDSSAITTEYATADPVYQVKTASLPQSFAHYRTCRGDGHCGWRAVTFCYFEALVRIADPYKFQEEVTRLKSMGNLMAEAGYEEAIYVDFADEAWDLLPKLASAPAESAMAILTETFNDLNLSLAIITYFKLLTAAWMKKYPDQYQPYIDVPLHQYVGAKVESANCEMEELALSAMLGVLVSPAGIAAEVHYLDRSPGDTINVIQYGWQGSERPSAKIRLLYRPGHYDILYKTEDLMVSKSLPITTSQPSHQQNVFVALQHSRSEPLHQRTPFHPDALEIPGMSFFNPGQASWPPAMNHYDFAPSPMSPAVATSQTAVTPSYPGVPNVPVHDMYFQSTPMPPSTMSSMTLPHHLHVDRDTPFRPSAWEYTLDINHATHQSLCQTAIFRNSHYNTAHFNNPDFEPEQWQPDDYATADRSRKKSSYSS